MKADQRVAHARTHAFVVRGFVEDIVGKDEAEGFVTQGSWLGL